MKKLKHAYLYHQSIGFLMERAGYETQELNQFRKLGIEYDFYLDYNMKDMKYDPNWKLYYPKNLR